MYYISAARYPGKKVSRLGVRFGLLLPYFLTLVCLSSSQTLYWATPPQRWWRNASLWGVKVGDQGVAWWAVYHRGRLSFWGGIAVGIWMIFDVGHAFCILSAIGFDHWLYGNSPGGRLLNATTNINMSITGQKNVTPVLTLNPKQRCMATIPGYRSSRWWSQTFDWKNGCFCTQQSN